jgi:Flp pilus assembly CpaF family ATPase
MNTGHEGTLTTIHASSAEGALRRIAALAVRAAGQMSIQDAEEEVRSAIDIVIQLARENGRRLVKEVVCRSDRPRRDSISVFPAWRTKNQVSQCGD